MEGSDFAETSRSTRMGSASHVPPGGWSQDDFEQEESELPSSSGRPTKRARRHGLDHCGGRQDEHHFSSLQLDKVKHKVFLSHSGAQKDFAEQLCADLERRGFIAPFFDQRLHSLLKGKDFVPLIKEAAQHCHVAVIVLSEEFLCSKWPMIELVEFHATRQSGNQRLNMLPVFYKLSVKDLDERSIEERWQPMWKQLASSDKRIDVEKWSDAVRALRGANGLVFGQRGLSEVGYRKDIVQSIFQLSPPDLLYGSSHKMVGYSRLCKRVCDRFVRGRSGGPSFLGLYGTSGAGKTTLLKALCDHLCGEYMGRVCHVELGETGGMGRACHVDLTETSRLRRVKRMLERLFGVDKELLDRISDFDEGLMLMRMHMTREPVFLAIDNVTSSSWDEARKYLMAGFHPGSRIVITSRSRSNIGNLVPDMRFCVPMPRLSMTEAGELFLRSAAPSKSIFGLTTEERRIVGLCIQQCLFEAKEDEVGYDYDEDEEEDEVGDDDDLDEEDDEVGDDDDLDEVGSLVEGDVIGASLRSYHPVALSALGDFFRRYFENVGMLRWKDHLEENKDPLWDLWKVPNGIGGIIGLQFHSLPLNEQLLFLDVSAFFSSPYKTSAQGNIVWLCKVHEETWGGMERRLQDLERSGMINLHYNGDAPYVGALDIYKRFAEWFVTNHGVKRWKNAWCVYKTAGFTLNQDSVASDLVRLRMFDLPYLSGMLLTSKTMRELQNLEVLQLYDCPYLTELNLEGLENLRVLELVKLRNLVAVTLTGSLAMAESWGILESLQYVVLQDLDSLVRGPDVRLCTSLFWYRVLECPRMMNLDEMKCPHLKELELVGMSADQFKRLPNFSALHSFENFTFSSKCNIALCDVEASRRIRLRDIGKPYLRVVEKVLTYLREEWVADDSIPGRQMSLIPGRGIFIRWFKQFQDTEYLWCTEPNGSLHTWGRSYGCSDPPRS